MSFNLKKKLAHRGNIEKMNPYFQLDQQDPYVRQNDAGSGSNAGRGPNLTRPGDEGTSGGFGTRFRGKEFPQDFSSSSQGEYENQTKTNIPGSYDDLLSNPPRKTDLGGWFYDPEDPLSTLSEIQNNKKNPEKPLENRLRQDHNPDDIFKRVRSKQKGIYI